MKHFCQDLPNVEFECPIIPTIVGRLKTTIVNGRARSVQVNEEIDPNKVNEGLKVSDFNISTLVENNATDLLKPNHRTISPSRLDMAHSVDSAISNIPDNE